MFKERLFRLLGLTYYRVWINVETKRVHIFKCKRNNSTLYSVTTLHMGKVIMPENVHRRVTSTTYYYADPTHQDLDSFPNRLDPRTVKLPPGTPYPRASTGGLVRLGLKTPH